MQEIYETLFVIKNDDSYLRLHKDGQVMWLQWRNSRELYKLSEEDVYKMEEWFQNG